MSHESGITLLLVLAQLVVVVGPVLWFVRWAIRVDAKVDRVWVILGGDQKIDRVTQVEQDVRSLFVKLGMRHHEEAP